MHPSIIKSSYMDSNESVLLFIYNLVIAADLSVVMAHVSMPSTMQVAAAICQQSESRTPCGSGL